MENRTYAKPLIAALFGILLAASFTGGSPAPIEFVHETCKDTIDNDNDGITSPIVLIRADFGDGECVWMPFDIGIGEYDGLGGNDPSPSSPEVQAYANLLLNLPNEYPTQHEALKAMGVNTCSDTTVQDSFTSYRDAFGVSPSTLGIAEHQNECGLSY